MKFLLLLTLAVAAYAAQAPFYDAGENGIKGRYIVVLQVTIIIICILHNFDVMFSSGFVVRYISKDAVENKRSYF